MVRTVRESGSIEDAGVPHGGLYGDAHDEWGVLPHHFEIIPPSSEKVTKGGNLKQSRSMPFPTRQAPDEIAPAVPSYRPPPTSRRTRKNSKVAQFLGIAGTPEKVQDAVDSADPFGLMSPPILPMEVDPFTGPPLGAAIVSNVVPTHPQAPQHTFRPMLSMPSLSVPSDHHATHTHAPRAHAHKSTSDFHDTTARRAPRPLHRAGYTPFGTLSSRSLSNPPPPLPSQPLHPSRAVNLEGKTRRGLTSTRTRHQGGLVAPLVRDTAATHRGRHHNMHDHASTAVPNLRKARSSVVLSNTPLLPLHAPKPVKAMAKPSAETLRILVESASATPSRSSNVRNRVVDGGSAHAVWPPAPVLRPLRITNPERDAYRSAANEAEKAYHKIKEDRALLERVRDVGGYEASRKERDSEPRRSRNHRRAATEGTRRRKREVEYLTLADCGFDPTTQRWTGGR